MTGDVPSSDSRAATAQSGKAGAPQTRMPFTVAFRRRSGQCTLREDLAALPWIALHTKALWIPLLITLASTVAIIATAGRDAITQFLFAYFIQTPAIGGVFIAGFLAPRASWLLGVIVGLVSAACYSLLVISFPSTIYAAPPTAEQARDVGDLGVHLLADHRRVLRRSRGLVSPVPGPLQPEPWAAQAQGQKQRPSDGRTRGGTTSQKAGAKR